MKIVYHGLESVVSVLVGSPVVTAAACLHESHDDPVNKFTLGNKNSKYEHHNLRLPLATVLS